MLPQNDQHVVSSSPDLPPMAGKLVIPPPVDGLSRLTFGGGGERSHLLCGFLSSDDYNPLLATLPKLLTIDVEALGSANWIESSMRFALAELARGHPASSNVMSRLSELLLIEAVRSYAKGSAINEDASWLRGIGDPQIGRALALMHGIGQQRTDDRDACARGGAIPDGLHNAVHGRNGAASDELPESMAPARRADHAGRGARDNRPDQLPCRLRVEEAFSRAFKKEYGMAPGQYQKRAADAA